MDKAVQKFIRYLEVDYLKLRESLDSIERLGKIQTQLATIKNMINILSVEREDWENSREIFQDFSILSKYLLASTLNSRECLQIIANLVEKNIVSGFTQENSINVDGKDILNHHFQTISNEEAIEMFYSGKISDLFAADEKELTLLERKQQKELFMFVENYCISTTKMVESSKIMNSCYLKKKDRYQKEDIEKIVIALHDMEVNPKLCEGIEFILEKDFQKRNLSLKKQTRKYHNQEAVSSFAKDDSKLREEIRNYFDIRNECPVRSLTLEEQIECAIILKKLGYSKEALHSILKMIKLENEKEPINPMKQYIDSYPRLKYYEGKYGLQQELKEMEDSFCEAIISDDETYQFWKNNIQKNLQNINKWIPNNFDYEFSEIDKRISKQYSKRK